MRTRNIFDENQIEYKYFGVSINLSLESKMSKLKYKYIKFNSKDIMQKTNNQSIGIESDLIDYNSKLYSKCPSSQKIKYSKLSLTLISRSVVSKSSPGFSMIELLFVIVILGILASLALPRLQLSRTNAMSVAIQSDIQTIITSTQEYAITSELLPQNANPRWLISFLHLSPQRWVVSGDMLKIAKNGVVDSQNDCVSIRFDGVDYLQILFNQNLNSNLCQSLLKNYSGDISVPLNIAI